MFEEGLITLIMPCYSLTSSIKAYECNTSSDGLLVLVKGNLWGTLLESLVFPFKTRAVCFQHGGSSDLGIRTVHAM